jgi:hypothetical protein
MSIHGSLGQAQRSTLNTTDALAFDLSGGIYTGTVSYTPPEEGVIP